MTSNFDIIQNIEDIKKNIDDTQTSFLIDGLNKLDNKITKVEEPNKNINFFPNFFIIEFIQEQNKQYNDISK